MRPRDFSNISDADLVAAANRGDTDAFAALYQRYRQWVADLAWRHTRDRELAVDVVQETFLYLLGKFPGFQLRASMKTFLFPVVRHLSITLQQRGRRATPGLGQSVPDRSQHTPGPLDNEGLEELARAVERLPAGQREVLLLRLGDELPLDEIAAALGIPLGTVKSRLHNALETLARDESAKKYFSQ